MVLKEGEHASPLWVQSRQTIDPDTYNPAVHGTAYGRTPESRLLSGLAGHNLCFPFWGNPSAAEFAAGMTFHGECNIRRWELLEESPDGLVLEVRMPESGTRLRRTLRCRGHALHCDSEAMNVGTWDRPFAWCEHVTIGPPFLESDAVRFDASLGKGFITGESLSPHFSWPHGFGPGSEKADFDLSTFAAGSHDDLVNSFLVKSAGEWGFFTTLQRRFGLLFGYVFPKADFPWLNVWESNNAKIQARGMEFSNTPHHGTMKTLIRSAEIWGAPTYEWLDALSSVSKRFIAFLHPAPSDYRGTADIRLRPDVLEVIERETWRVIEVPI